MYAKLLLRAEGFAAFVAATVVYFTIDASLWLYLALALAPDLSMLGYLASNRIGSLIYNAAHTYLGPVALLAVGTMGAVPLAVPVGLVWVAHIGADRAVGYGLKYPTGFKDTHLGRAGVSAPEPTPSGDPVPGTVD